MARLKLSDIKEGTKCPWGEVEYTQPDPHLKGLLWVFTNEHEGAVMTKALLKKLLANRAAIRDWKLNFSGYGTYRDLVWVEGDSAFGVFSACAEWLPASSPWGAWLLKARAEMAEANKPKAAKPKKRK